jgi:hypothetical protein
MLVRLFTRHRELILEPLAGPGTARASLRYGSVEDS